MLDWLLKEIGQKIDITQYGGLKGQSTTHYLIDLVNFVLYNQDIKDPNAILAIMYDFSKAFNRQEHNRLIIILSDMGTPGWLLRLVMAFLENRRMILEYQGCASEEEPLSGGGPAGTKLGLFLFLVLINKAGYKPSEINVKIAEHMTKPKRVPIEKTQEKYVDDMTHCVSMNLKKVTELNPDQTTDLPRQYRERTGHILKKRTQLYSTGG